MSGKLIFKTKQGIYALPVEDIVFMEKDRRKIRVYTEERTMEFYGSFKEYALELDKRFLYCHRSYIINMDKIILMADSYIFMTGNISVFFGRDTYSRARKIFYGYLRDKFQKPL